MHAKTIALIAVLLLTTAAVRAQTALPQTGTTGAQTSPSTISLSLADALARARANSPQFQAALMQLGLAREDREQARAALLPGVDYNNSFIYTQGNRTSTDASSPTRRARVPQPGSGAADLWRRADR